MPEDLRLYHMQGHAPGSSSPLVLHCWDIFASVLGLTMTTGRDVAYQLVSGGLPQYPRKKEGSEGYPELGVYHDIS